MLKLPEYAKRLGISRAHALSLYKRGELPHSAQQIGPRTIIVDVPPDFGLNKPKGKTVAYCRVSTGSQKQSLQNQKLRVLEYCAKNAIHLDDCIEEIASGMNGKRRKLNKILKDPTITQIIIEHRERLSRINYELIESALNSRNCKITIIETNEIEDDLVRDITEVLTSFCARFYSQRGARARAQKIAKEVIINGDNKEN